MKKERSRDEVSSQTNDADGEEPCSAVAAALEQELARLKAREEGKEDHEEGVTASGEAESSGSQATRRRNLSLTRKLSGVGLTLPSLKGDRKLSLPGRKKLSGQAGPSSPKSKEALPPPRPPKAGCDASTPPDQTDATPPLAQRGVGVMVKRV